MTASADRPTTLRDAALSSLAAKRRFRANLLKAAVLVPVLVVIWAITEYHNAGGWPTAFATGRRNHDWDPWIIYPLIAVVAYLAISAWLAYGRAPLTDADVEREMERLAGRR
jgi:hypothetical protein